MKIKHWLIKKLVGKSTVIMNATFDQNDKYLFTCDQGNGGLITGCTFKNLEVGSEYTMFDGKLAFKGIKERK